MTESDPKTMQLKNQLHQEIKRLIKECHVQYFISGMDRGIDTWFAEIVLKLKRKYPVMLECALPYEEQAADWNESDRNRYFRIIESADKESILQTQYTSDCLLRRNEYMLNLSDYVIVVFSEEKTNTITALQNAKQNGITIIELHVD
jgi:uncharacterized phage-like protein YoqJ